MTEDIGTTARDKFSPTRRLRIFEARKGMCCICGKKIAGSFIIEHLRALALGGDNSDDNLGVAHRKCAEVKTRDSDMPRINKAKAQKKAQHGIKSEPTRKIQQRAKAERPKREQLPLLPPKQLYVDLP